MDGGCKGPSPVSGRAFAFRGIKEKTAEALAKQADIVYSNQ